MVATFQSCNPPPFLSSGDQADLDVKYRHRDLQRWRGGKMGGMKTQPPELKKFMDKKLSGQHLTV